MRYSTGLVTLNLSIVVMMIAGVVRKKRRMKRTTLMTRQRSHQMKPRMERCSLRSKRCSLWVLGIRTPPKRILPVPGSFPSHQYMFWGSGA